MTTRATKQAKTGPEIVDLDGDGRRFAFSVDGVIRFTGSRADCENRRRILFPAPTREHQNHQLTRILRVLLLAALVGLAVPRGTEGASTINTALPVQGQSYNAAPIRQNFTAAAADILALQRMNAGATAPASPTLGMLWLETPTGETSYNLKIWNDRLAAWVQVGTLDSLNGLWITNVGGGLPETLLTDDTVDLGSVPNAVITITGAGPVLSFGSSAPPGTIKVLIFSGATELTYNATSMILPGATDLTTAAGDIAIFTSLTSGNWQGLFFQGATTIVAQGGTGRATLTDHAVLLGSGTSPIDFAVPSTSGHPLLSTGAASDPAFGQLDLNGAGTTGTLAVNRGGTALAALTAHALILGNGTGTPTLLIPGLADLPLVSNGVTLDPSYKVLTVSGGGTGASILGLYSIVAGGGTGPLTGIAPSTAGHPLLSTGAGAYPVFGQLNLAGAGVTGTLPTANLAFTIPNASLISANGTTFAGVTVGTNLSFAAATLSTSLTPTFTTVTTTGVAMLDSASVTGNVTAATLASTGNTTVGGTVGIVGNTTVGGTLGVTGALTTATNVTVGGNLAVTGTATVTSNIVGNGTLNIAGAGSFAATLGVGGTTTLSGDLAANGTSTMAGDVFMTTLGVTPNGNEPVCVNVVGQLFKGAGGVCPP